MITTTALSGAGTWLLLLPHLYGVGDWASRTDVTYSGSQNYQRVAPGGPACEAHARSHDLGVPPWFHQICGLCFQGVLWAQDKTAPRGTMKAHRSEVSRVRLLEEERL